MTLDSFKQIAESVLPSPIKTISLMSGGRNSQVYRLTCEDGIQYVLKAYFRHESDKRDRLKTEYKSLRFLWEHGLRNIPKAIAAIPEYECVIYSYVEGKKINNEDIKNQDINQAVSFLNNLEILKKYQEGWNLKAASEACFSIHKIWVNIQERLTALIQCYIPCISNSPLRDFIEHDFYPAKEKIYEWCSLKLNSAKISFDRELDKIDRTLSPSDFGFHNALRVENGDLAFLDFEYFGWDDPAKMVVDMLHHPGMNLSLSQKQRFVYGILEHFHKYTNLSERIEIVYPLFGLKWCLILLNEFLPERLMLRKFAGMNTNDHQALQSVQLNKARTLLNKVINEYDNFPYFN